MADLRSAWAEVGHLRPLVERSHFESTAGTGGGFFKNQGNVFANQGLFFSSGFFGRFQFDREIDQVLDLCRCVVSSLRKLRFFKLMVIRKSFLNFNCLMPSLCHLPFEERVR